VKANLDTPIESTVATSSRRRRTVAAALVGLLALTACTSDPGPRRVAEDIIEGEYEEGNITEAEHDCMFAVLKDDYSEDELVTIAELIESTNEANVAEGEAEVARLRNDLSACTA
jgi:hypothetical protein